MAEGQDAESTYSDCGALDLSSNGSHKVKIFKLFKKKIDNSLIKGRAHDWGGGRGRGGLFEPGQEEDGELVRGGGQEEVAQVELIKM